MTSLNTLTLESRIQQIYAQLSSSEKKLADVVLQNQKGLLGYSATELATMAGTSKSTAARFFLRLGYQGFDEFRSQVREQQTKPSPLARMASNKTQLTKTQALHNHFNADAQRLKAWLDNANEANIDAAVTILGSARRIWIIGYRHSHITAMYAHGLLSHIHTDVHLLHDTAGTDAEMLAALDERDVLLVIDFRRRSQRLTRIVPAARELGTRVVLISDVMASKITPYADAILCCPNEDQTNLFDSYVCALSLVNYIATSVALLNKAHTKKRLATIERMHIVLESLDGLT